MDVMDTVSRKGLLRWLGWFYLTNALLVLAVTLNYIHSLPNLHLIAGATEGRVALAWLFMITAFITQALLWTAPVLLVGALVIACRPKWQRLRSIVCVVAMCMVLGIIIDYVAFQLFHTHNMTMAWEVFQAGALSQVMPLSLAELSLLCGLACVLLLIEFGLAVLLWRVISRTKATRLGKVITIFLMVVMLFSYAMMAAMLTFPTAHRLSEQNSRLLLKVARMVPYFSGLYVALVPGSENYVRHVPVDQATIPVLTRQMNRPLQYPASPLACVAPSHPMNIVFLVIDTWRYDAFSQAITPHIKKFSQHALQFQNNWSGGNCTQSGIFSLFYALPASYWKAVKAQHQGPVFLKQLMREGYQLGIFGSATLKFPSFDKTVFQDVPHVQWQTKGVGSIVRDHQITKNFLHFLTQRNRSKPFFSFLFYDAAHDYCGGGPTAHQAPFSPAIKYCKRFELMRDSNPVPYLNRYHNAVYGTDQEVGRVLAALKKQGLLDHTLVVITADHGEEFDDEHLDYWSHASAYTPYQLHVPLVIAWPHRGSYVYHFFTTHHDIVPTLMKHILGCHAPVAQYSVGRSLFLQGHRPYLISGSYTDYAVVEQHKITRIYPGGDYVINHANGYHFDHAKMDVGVMRRVYADVTRWFG